ncbi:hypothetical protein JYU34_011915 [Plutella xylostella]|uniref:Transmembrane protein n=1 Tax=Plutella xylostella TaxID=51655 RepID=A0ABQ7QDU5_PLUXY|nr:hypothetical protein JYU34_011915 [Plutella xylostella]
MNEEVIVGMASSKSKSKKKSSTTNATKPKTKPKSFDDCPLAVKVFMGVVVLAAIYGLFLYCSSRHQQRSRRRNTC